MLKNRILVAVTGASGSIYAQRLIEELVEKVERVYLIASPSGKQVCQIELTETEKQVNLNHLLNGDIPQKLRSIIRVFGYEDLCAPVASGSSAPTHMVVIPCSMGSLARIASGISGNLIERSADVMLKQKRPLIIVPRETPLNTIHLRNMLSLSEMGCSIVPAMPAFYQKPTSVMDLIDFVIGRILELCGCEHTLYRPWNARMR